MRLAARLTAGLVVLASLAGCAQETRDKAPLIVTIGSLAVAEVTTNMRERKEATKKKKGPSRADLEKPGEPVLRAAFPSLGADRYLSVFDTKGEVVTWKTTDGTTVTLRDGILIQTRGLGPDLMSASVPTVGQLLTNGGTHERQYYFLGPDDQMTRRTYDCTVTIVGQEEVVIIERKHSVTHAQEECTRPQTGKITNDFWFEGKTMRQSRQWVSAMTGFVELQRVVD